MLSELILFAHVIIEVHLGFVRNYSKVNWTIKGMRGIQGNWIDRFEKVTCLQPPA